MNFSDNFKGLDKLFELNWKIYTNILFDYDDDDCDSAKETGGVLFWYFMLRN